MQHSAGVAFKRGVGGGGLVRVQSHRRSSDGAFPVVRLSPQHFPPPHSISLDPHLNTRHFFKFGVLLFRPISIELSKILNLTIDDIIINCKIKNIGQLNTNWCHKWYPATFK